jgi:hypothetical protein
MSAVAKMGFARIKESMQNRGRQLSKQKIL